MTNARKMVCLKFDQNRRGVPTGSEFYICSHECFVKQSRYLSEQDWPCDAFEGWDFDNDGRPWNCDHCCKGMNGAPDSDQEEQKRLWAARIRSMMRDRVESN